MQLVFHYWNISWTLFPVSGICESFSSLAARSRLYSQPCLAVSPPSIPLGVLSWTVSSFCPSLLRGFLSCKMCVIYFEICKQSPRNPSRSYQGDLRPRLLANMRCEVQLYCQPEKMVPLTAEKSIAIDQLPGIKIQRTGTYKGRLCPSHRAGHRAQQSSAGGTWHSVSECSGKERWMREAESSDKLFLYLAEVSLTPDWKACLQRDHPADDPSCSSLGRDGEILCCGLYLASPRFLPVYTKNIFYALWIAYH